MTSPFETNRNHGGPIAAKIATITSDFEVAVNAGSDAGVSSGDQFRLFRSVAIQDPDSGEELGSVRYVRATFEITIVANRYSLAKAMDTSPGGWANTLKYVTAETDADPDQFIIVQVGEPGEIVRTVANNQEEPPF